ncbi:MAG: hypothetical protein GX674_00970 [Clostridiales bacterium]|nr:hypothetical protein [Clostridiales bacterium]
MSQRQSGPHARAASASIGHFGQYILITLEQLLLRAIALSPLIYALVSGQFFGLRREYVLAAALLSALVLWTLLALPARLRMGAQLSGWFGAQINAGSWSDRLAKGLVPFAKALPLVLPVFICLYILYYVFSFSGFPVFFKMLEYPGSLIAGILGGLSADIVMTIGVLVWVIVLAMLAWLAFRGWRRFMVPCAYLHQCSRAKGKPAKLVGRITLINFLIILPPVAIVLILLALSLAPKLSGSMMFDVLTVVSAVTGFDFPAHTLTQCAWVLGLVYLPFVLLRKAAIAAGFHGRT